MTTGQLPQCLRAPVDCPAGAEPRAVRGDRHGILVLHGLTGSPWEVMPLATALAAEGRSVAVPLLAGHGTTPRALECTHWSDWLASGRDALRWLERHCRRIDVVGFSMGGLVALRLIAEVAPAQRGRLVLLAPALAIQPWQSAALRTLRRVGLAPVLAAPNAKGPVAQRPPRYDVLPLRAVYEMLDFQKDVLNRPAPSVEAALLLHGLADRSIPAERSTALAQAHLGSALEAHLIARAGHLLLTDAGGADRVAEVLHFIHRPSADSANGASAARRGPAAS